MVVGSAKDEQRRERSEPAFEVQPSVSLVRNLPQVPGNQDPCDETSAHRQGQIGHHDTFGELHKRHHLRAYRTALRIPRNQQGAAEAVQKATAARAELFLMLALAPFSERGAYSKEAHQQLQPTTGVPQATNLMSRFVRTFEPIPKYRRYLRLIAALSSLWCHPVRPIQSKRSSDEQGDET